MPTSGVVVGVDLLHADEPQADLALHRLLAALPDPAVGSSAATHWAVAGTPHVALSLHLLGVDGEGAFRLVGRALQVLVDDVGPGAPWALATEGRAGGAPALLAPARAAARAHASGAGGRAVHFPGAAELVGVLPVGAVLQRSAVDRVQVLLGGEADPASLLDTRGHVRPSWVDGQLVLLVQAAAGGTLVPFESPHPTPCCVDHHP